MNRNIYEYLNYYKDYTFDEVLFNIMDALLFSMLIYLPMESRKDELLLKDLNKCFKEYKHGAIAPISLDLYRIVSNSKTPTILPSGKILTVFLFVSLNFNELYSSSLKPGPSKLYIFTIRSKIDLLHIIEELIARFPPFECPHI